MTSPFAPPPPPGLQIPRAAGPGQSNLARAQFFGGQQLPAGAIGQPTLTPAMRFGILFGGGTPQQAVAQRAQGQPTLTAQPGGAPPAPAAPAVPSGAGGQAQAAAPGAMTGNPDQGFAGPASQFQDAQGQAIAAGTLPAGSAAGMGTLIPPELMLPGQDGLQSFLSGPGGLSVPQDLGPENVPQQTPEELLGGVPAEGRDNFMMTPEIQAAIEGLMTQQGAGDVGQDRLRITPELQAQQEALRQSMQAPAQKAATDALAPPSLDDLSERGQFNETGIFKRGRAVPWTDAGYNAIDRHVSGDEKTNARISYIQNSDGAWTDNFWRRAFGQQVGKGLNKKNKQLPQPGDVADETQGLNLDEFIDRDAGGFTDENSFANQVTNQGVQDLVGQWAAWGTELQNARRQGADDQQDKKTDELRQKIRTAEAALGEYGFEFSSMLDEVFDPSEVVEEGEGTQDGTPVGDDEIVDPITGEPVEPDLTPDPLGGDDFSLSRPSTTFIPKILEQLFPNLNSLSNEDKFALAELAGQFNVETARQENRQKSVNELVRNLNAFQSDPFFTGFRQQASDIAGQSNLDFDALRAQATGDVARGLDRFTGGLSEDFGVRGLSPAAASGLQAQAALQANDQLARQLGELSFLEQQTARDFALQNLGVTGEALGLTTSPVSLLRQQIAQAIGAPELQPTNALESVFDVGSALRAFDLQDEAIDEARDQAGLNNILAGIGGLGGILGGTGGLLTGIGALGGE